MSLAVVWFLCCFTQSSRASRPAWKGKVFIDIGGFGVLPTKPEREDQYYEQITAGYEAPAWRRHTLGASGRLLLYHDPENDIAGVCINVSDRIWFKADVWNGYYVLVRGSLLYVDKKFQKNDAQFNFSSEMHIGYRWEKSGIYLQLGMQHTSNGYIRRPNTGVNAAGISMGIWLP
jgi:hypothetical protein